MSQTSQVCVEWHGGQGTMDWPSEELCDVFFIVRVGSWDFLKTIAVQNHSYHIISGVLGSTWLTTSDVHFGRHVGVASSQQVALSRLPLYSLERKFPWE